uniref:DUF4468 domain-containing protein n=1 Tax=Heterorhabditis bacteriophora TaxID=37862 RepID=A0A1I7WXY1_HETBA
MTAEGKISGAQQSLIEKAKADRLGVAKKNAEYYAMSGIGGITESFKSYEVQLDMISAYGTKIIIKIKTKPNMFDLEGIGIRTDEFSQDESAYQYYEQLKNNYNMLISLQRNICRNEEQKKWYWKIIEQYQNGGVIEAVKWNVRNSVGTYYMRYTGVWKPGKSKPLKVVFDTSSKQKASPSILNMAISAFLSSKEIPLANEILQNLYVDNVLLTAATDEELLQKYKE